jgi:hypothetical protein
LQGSDCTGLLDFELVAHGKQEQKDQHGAPDFLKALDRYAPIRGGPIQAIARDLFGFGIDTD